MAVESMKQTGESTNPGVTVVEGSTNGKTCHQCRQKRMDIVGTCVTKKRDNTCPLKFCPKCLLNRYGENAEEVAVKTDWICPKCRGNCNCSLCMKKRGQRPTGILVHTAKATGFSSVSELLKTEGSDKFFYKKKVKPEDDVVASLLGLWQENYVEQNHVDIKKSKKSKREELKDINNGCSKENAAVKESSPKRIKTVRTKPVLKKKEDKPEDAVVASLLKLGQENSVEQNHVDIKKSKKSKREELKDINNSCSKENAAVKKSSPKRIKIARTKPVLKKKEEKPEDAVVASLLELGQENSVKQNHVDIKKSKKSKREELKDINNGCSKENTAVKKSSPKRIKIARTKPVLKKKEEYQLAEVKIPQGISSITVSGIDVPPEDAGNVFQFLEFCSAFGKALDLRKGQAECVIREMLSGRSKRRQQHSTLTQMIIQLLTVILEDRGETSVCLSANDDSWLTAIGECLSESEVQFDYFPPEMFQEGIDAYEKLDSSKRLKLLNFLCDETLGTSLLRNCIDNLESVGVKKEAKETLNAAKEKEKQLKQKLQDELAKAVTKNNGIPLTIQKHDEIVSQINAETAEARSAMQNAMDMLSKKSQGCDAVVRTNPVELDDNGLVFWRLKSYKGEPNILLQDFGSWSEVCPHEKWFAFTSEQKPEIEKYISFKRMKRLRAKKNAKTVLVS